jgi:glycosyltransferase involved in cell wall biosynthesis
MRIVGSTGERESDHGERGKKRFGGIGEDVRVYRAYIYPRSVLGRLSTGIHNPYVNNFIRGVSDRIEFLNKDHRSSIGILDLLRYVGKFELLILNWVENLPARKGGYIQGFLFVVMAFLKSRIGFKIIWTMHNKVSHSSKHLFMKKILFRTLLRKSDLIITHSSEGVRYAQETVPGIDREKIFFFTHPVVPNPLKASKERQYDILIWGSLAPYKGVHNFLQYLEDKGISEKYSIKIVGECTSEEYYRVLSRYGSQQVSIENRFAEKSELEELMAAARFVLFTYSGESVLSSGALMDSLACKATVIGPDVGAFRDAGRAGVIKTYKTFDEIPGIIWQLKDRPENELVARIDEFVNAHTWEKFSRAFIERLSEMDRSDSHLN